MKKIIFAIPAIVAAVLVLAPAVTWGGAESQIAMERAKVEFSAGNYDNALGLLNEVLAEEPDNAEALQYAGLALMGLGRPTDAIGRFERVAELSPGADVYADLAWAAVEAEDYEKGLSASTQALQYDPVSSRAILFQGRSLLGLGRNEEALDKFRGLVGEPQYDQAALLYSGMALVNLGRVDEAISYFERAEAAGPDTELGRSAASYRAVLQREELQPLVTRPYAARLRMLYQYDTNIVPVNDDNYLPEEISEMEDGRLVVDLDLSYKFIDEQDSKAQVRYLGYGSWHGQEEESNLMFHMGELSGYHQIHPGELTVRFGGGFNYSYAALDSETYSNNMMGTLGAGVFWTPALRTRIIADYFGETFEESGEGENNRDNTGARVTLYQHFFFFDGALNTYVGYRYAQVAAEGDNYNRVDNVGLAGVVAAFPRNTLVFLNYRYEDRQYPDNSFDREETRNVVNFGFETMIYGPLSFYGGVIYTGVDANIEFLEYTRWIYTAGLMVQI